MTDLPCPTPHALTAGSVLQALGVDREGLTPAETETRLRLYGANALPKGHPPSLVRIFLRQFLSPLIYVLLLAGIISLIRGAFGDAVFIGVVILINAIIGTTQEWSAQRAAAALKYLVPSRARVQRVGEIYEIDAEELVPGDIVVLAVGDKVPADLRLLCAQGLELDESVLTGESLPVVKRPEAVLSPETPISDRINCVSPVPWSRAGEVSALPPPRARPPSLEASLPRAWLINRPSRRSPYAWNNLPGGSPV